MAIISKKGLMKTLVSYSNAGSILIEMKYREGAPFPGDAAIAELSGEAAAPIVATKIQMTFAFIIQKAGKT